MLQFTPTDNHTRQCYKPRLQHPWPLSAEVIYSGFTFSEAKLILSPTKMAFQPPDAKKLQTLSDIANKMRIHSVNMTQASGSGYVYLIYNYALTNVSILITIGTQHQVLLLQT